MWIPFVVVWSASHKAFVCVCVFHHEGMKDSSLVRLLAYLLRLRQRHGNLTRHPPPPPPRPPPPLPFPRPAQQQPQQQQPEQPQAGGAAAGAAAAPGAREMHNKRSSSESLAGEGPEGGMEDKAGRPGAARVGLGLGWG